MGIVLFWGTFGYQNAKADSYKLVGNSLEVPFTFHYNNTYGFSPMNTALKLQLIKISPGKYGLSENIEGVFSNYIKQYGSGNLVLNDGTGKINCYLPTINFSDFPKIVQLTDNQVLSLMSAIQCQNGYFSLANLTERGPWHNSGQLLSYATSVVPWSGIVFN